MIRFRIQLSRVFKSLNSLFLLGALSLLPVASIAQCGVGFVEQHVTYTTPLSTPGGNNYSVSVPQFNPTAGQTLLSVVYSSFVTTSTGLGFQNTQNFEQFIFPQINRQDVVKINGTTTVTGNSVNSTWSQFVDLQPSGMAGDNASYGPIAAYANTPVIYDSITNAAQLATSYTGSGNLNLTYSSNFFVNSVPVGVTVNSSFNDNITFAVTYYYCTPYILAANFLSFTATRENASTALLKWSTTNEEPGRTYDVQVTQTGSDFSTVGSLPSSATGSDANYSYEYSIPTGATGKLYFRIKQIDLDGSPSYSVTCVVNLDGGGTPFSIFPNPATSFVSLTLPGGNQNWQVDIIAADGNLVQRNAFANTSLVTVNFARKLAAGVYFVRATNTNTAEQHVASFVIHQ
jgi:Secretion system C-terminal sorting domain